MNLSRQAALGDTVRKVTEGGRLSNSEALYLTEEIQRLAALAATQDIEINDLKSGAPLEGARLRIEELAEMVETGKDMAAKYLARIRVLEAQLDLERRANGLLAKIIESNGMEVPA